MNARFLTLIAETAAAALAAEFKAAESYRAQTNRLERATAATLAALRPVHVRTCTTAAATDAAEIANAIAADVNRAAMLRLEAAGAALLEAAK
jgi:hypothetical protein